MKPIVMIVDDDPQFLDSLETLLSQYYRVESCDSGEEALEVRKSIINAGKTIDVYISNQIMPGMEGLDLFRSIAKDTDDKGIRMLLTAYADIKVATTGINEQIIDFYDNKPIEPKKLLQNVEELIRRKRKTSEILKKESIFPAYIKPDGSEKIQNILITGATGFLGKEFIAELLDKTDVDIYAVVRDKQGVPFNQRKELAGLFSKRLKLIDGDITSPDVCNISALPPIHEVWHLAGSTDFQEDRRVWTYKLNVDGVSHIVELTKRLGAKRLFHTSTAYVAGTIDELVFEDNQVNNPIFRNPYEETKYQAESIIRKSGIPFTIMRPSIILGNSISGEADSDKMVYGVIKLYHRLLKLINREYRDKGGLPSEISYYVKGKPETTLNLIAIDDVTSMMLKVRESGEIGKTYHLCNPVYATAIDIHNNIQNVLGMNLLELTGSPPQNTNKDKKQEMVNKGVGVYGPYMMQDDPKFDFTNIEKIFPLETVKRFDQRLQSFLYQNYIKGRLERKSAEQKKEELDLARLEDITEFGNQTISYSSIYTTLDTFKVPGIKGFLPFARAEGTAVLVGNPLTDDIEKIIHEFINMCGREGLNPSAIQITEKAAKIFADHEFLVNKLGIETHICLDEYDPSLRGKEYQQLRRWKNNASKFELTIEERNLSKVNKQVVLELSEKWLDTKENKSELGILLRKMSLDDEPYVRRFFGYSNNKMVGYIFFDPLFLQSSTIGYYSNIERYHTEQNIHGILPNIIMNAAERFKGEGIKYLSLGLSPLYNIDGNSFPENEVLKGIFVQFYNESVLYAFKGIAQHKQKYPATREIPVYFASRKDSSINDIFNIFNSIGILRMENE